MTEEGEKLKFKEKKDVKNFEKIKAMTIEEMAEFIARIQLREGKNKEIPASWQTVENITRGQIDWLKKEVEE